MSIPTKKEIKTATQVIGVALLKAREAMESMIKSSVSIKKIDYTIEKGLYEAKFKSSGQVYVMKTELAGDLQGACFLLFSEEEVNKLLAACLPAKILNDASDEARLMREGFLTEMDNIVSAAVISRLSDLLQISFFGTVPEMEQIKSEDIDKYLLAQSCRYESLVNFKAELHSDKLKITPHFTWMIKEDIVQGYEQRLANLP